MMNEPINRPGLQGVIAAQTRLSRVNGAIGELIIGGYRLEDFAAQATFEEVVYLLWYDHFPNTQQLATFRSQLGNLRQIPAIAIDTLRHAAQQQLPVMDALRMAAGLISLNSELDNPQQMAKALVAAFPTIVAYYWRLLQGQALVQPDMTLSHTANYLYMLEGEYPSADRVRALDTYLNTVIDHGFNASTFTARVIVSTQSDLVAAIVGAIGALKGPLHGGAPGPALDMVFEIGQADRAEAYLRQKLADGERLMGFGHRVYQVRDPRADVLNAAAEQFFKDGTQRELYDLTRHVEQEAIRLLALHKPERNLQTNVEFYTALLLHGLGLKTDLFTPTFAMARVGGWTAHALEHLSTGRLIRPLSEYIGETGRQYYPLSERK